MAPINEHSSYSTYSSTSTMKPFSCMCRHSLSDDREWFLPITRRGHFFQDSFFENARSLFDGAVRDILGRWEDTSMLTDSWHDSSNILSNLNRYRQLRSHNMKEENQAVTVSSDSSSYKIVLDVHEFSEGEIKVKVIAEKEVYVEGVTEGKDAEGHSASMKRFSRRFPLAEDSDVDGISSVMSSDGILTITVPKKVSSVCQESAKKVEHKLESSNNISRTANTSSSATRESSQSTSVSEKDTETEAGAKYCENCYKKLQLEKKLCEGTAKEASTKIPVSINSSVNNKSSSSVSMESQKVLESSAVSEKRMSSSTNSQMNSSLKQENSALSNQSEMKTAAVNNNEKCASESKNLKETLKEVDGTSRHVPISLNFRHLPVTRRGLFFNDSVFEDARNDFESAVREVLTKWNERSSIMDDLSSYRSLRTRDLREDNQAVKVSEDETTHKFVLDVHDFMNGGEVNVKAVSERELVVEGHIEKQEGGSKSVKRFYKRFVVPRDIVLESVTSMVSSDGVLTITAPKKAPTIQIRDITSPVRSEKTEEASLHCNQDVTSENQLSQASSSKTKTVQESSSSSSSSQKIHEVSSACQNNRAKEHIIQVHVEGKANGVNSEDTLRRVQGGSTSSQENFATKDSSAFSKESSVMSETSARDESSTGSSFHETASSTGTVRSQESVDVANAHQQASCSGGQSLASVGRLLPITRKGNFFSDTFFVDSRQDFQKAVKNVLQKFHENSQSDDLTAYRSLRHRNLSQENQALNIHEDEHSHKVVIDAKDFVDGDIMVSVVGERELLIEGRSENKEGSSSSSHTFSQRFLLPDSVDIHSITSAISSDGILTVESAKKGLSANSSNVQKVSKEASSRNENHSDSGHSWEEKNEKESLEQSEGYSCRSYSSSYRGHHEHSTSNVF